MMTVFKHFGTILFLLIQLVTSLLGQKSTMVTTSDRSSKELINHSSSDARKTHDRVHRSPTPLEFIGMRPASTPVVGNLFSPSKATSLTSCRLQIECTSKDELDAEFPGSSPPLSRDRRIRVPVRSAQGPRGPQGLQGTPGIPGPPGPRGLRGPPGDCKGFENRSSHHEINQTLRGKYFRWNRHATRKSDINQLAFSATQSRVSSKSASSSQPTTLRSQTTPPPASPPTITTTVVTIQPAHLFPIKGTRAARSRSRRFRRADKSQHTKPSPHNELGLQTLKEFVLPEGKGFTDRLVTLEHAFPQCILSTIPQQLISVAEECPAQVLDIISPSDGILIDWNGIEGISLEEFWNYFELALLNDTFTTPSLSAVRWQPNVNGKRMQNQTGDATYSGHLQTMERYLQRGAEHGRLPGSSSTRKRTGMSPHFGPRRTIPYTLFIFSCWIIILGYEY